MPENDLKTALAVGGIAGALWVLWMFAKSFRLRRERKVASGKC